MIQIVFISRIIISFIVYGSLTIFHIALHFLVPAIIAFAFFRPQWQKAYVIMMATMIVDIDHLLATPIYNPGRCSIGFHPLHTMIPIAIYAAMCFVPKRPIRLIGIGLIIHMMLDGIDCLSM